MPAIYASFISRKFFKEANRWTITNSSPCNNHISFSFKFNWDIFTGWASKCGGEYKTHMSRIYKIFSNIEIIWIQVYCFSLVNLLAGLRKLRYVKNFWSFCQGIFSHPYTDYIVLLMNRISWDIKCFLNFFLTGYTHTKTFTVVCYSMISALDVVPNKFAHWKGEKPVRTAVLHRNHLTFGVTIHDNIFNKNFYSNEIITKFRWPACYVPWVSDKFHLIQLNIWGENLLK